MTVVENSLHRFDRSFRLGITNSPKAMRRRSVKAVLYVMCFVEKLPLEGLVVNVTKAGVNITCQTLRESLSTELHNSDTTPHVNGKRCK
jgi:hypothetical protein